MNGLICARAWIDSLLKVNWDHLSCDEKIHSYHVGFARPLHLFGRLYFYFIGRNMIDLSTGDRPLTHTMSHWAMTKNCPRNSCIFDTSKFIVRIIKYVTCDERSFLPLVLCATLSDYNLCLWHYTTCHFTDWQNSVIELAQVGYNTTGGNTIPQHAATTSYLVKQHRK